jgi:D-aspartate ligase
MKIQPNGTHSVPVIITAHNSVNELGVARSLGRHGIPMVLLSSNRKDAVRYSKYISKTISCPHPKESESQFINFLLTQGGQMGRKCIIIPTSDAEVIALSRYKEDLEQYYLLPIPPFEVVQKLVNKKLFYQWLEQISMPYPRTYFPKDISELISIGREMKYPYIIKPAYIHLFSAEFHAKCFVINSFRELNDVADRLRGKDLEVMIQEIIPGKQLYSLIAYFNKKSEPIAVCGYDKPRQYPPHFGNGSLCISTHRPYPIDSSTQVLKALKYYGIAETEFKMDPRDGEYKFLEINARISYQSCLPSECGVDITYIAYLDTLGQYNRNSVSPQDGVLWIDEIHDLLSCLMQLKDRKICFTEAVNSWKGKKVFATFAWNDPIPLIVSLCNLAFSGLKRLFSRRRRLVC